MTKFVTKLTKIVTCSLLYNHGVINKSLFTLVNSFKALMASLLLTLGLIEISIFRWLPLYVSLRSTREETNMKVKPISLGLLLLFLIAAPSLWASPVVLSPIGADNDGVHAGPNWTIANTIDKSGLQKDFTSGVTSWDSYFGGVANHSGNFNFEWFSTPGILESNITYELGAIFKIDKIALWNEESYGISRLEVTFEYEDESSGDIVSQYWGELHPAKFSAAYPAEIFDLGSDFMASRVYLDVFGFAGNSYVSMGEIAFSATTPTPLPPAAFLLFSGLLGIVSFRRFKP